MRVRTKIFLSPLIVIAFLCLLGGISLLALRSQGASLDNIYQVRFVHYKISAEAAEALAESHSSSYRLISWISNYNEDKVKKVTQDILARIDKIKADLTQLSNSGKLTDAESQRIKAALGSIPEYRKTVAQSIDMASGDVNAGMALMQNADKLYLGIVTELNELVKLETHLSKQSYDDASVAYTRAVSTGAAFLVLAVVMSFAVSTVLGRKVTGPLESAIRLAQKVANGDLTTNIQVRGNDETSHLLQALRDMQVQLREIVSIIAREAGQLSDTAAAMSNTAQEIKQNAIKESDLSSATAAAVEEMTVSLEMVSGNVNVAHEMAENASSQSVRGQQLVNEASTEINHIADTVREFDGTIRTLQQQSSQISGIANVIKEIADQTNLLALNAAIEAARAGEQGRGFAVVADEVRKLAERTSGATSEIKSMIDSIQGHTDNAVSTISSGTAMVDSGVQLINGIVAPLEELKQGASVSLDKLRELTVSAREQTSSATLIAQNVEILASMSEKNAVLMSGAADSAARLEQLATSLKQAVARFQV